MLSTKLTIAFAVFSAALWAQWPAYKTPGAPRTATGEVDLSAPAPRTADDRPDLSGIWDRALPPGAPPPPSVEFGTPSTAGPGPFQNLPSLVPGGMPFLPWAADLRRERAVENSKDHPDVHCLPLHPVNMHSHPFPRKVVQTPDLVLILYEVNGGIRQIFTDGRPLPPGLLTGEVQPWWYGYSTGKWEGDTLVAETAGFLDLGWLDYEGTPITSTGRVTERFRRLNYGTLEIQITVNDPKTFTKPWTVTLQQRLMPDSELIEFVCQENNRSEGHLVGR